MLILLVLWLMATMDAALVGYRDAAGRSGLIHKRRYYLRALLRGLLYGQIAMAVAGLAAGLVLLTSGDRAALWRDVQQASTELLKVYGTYTLLVLLAFAGRLAPSLDVRSSTTVLILGPFQALRSIVAVAGLLWALWRVPRPELAWIGALVLVLMLSLESFLDWLRRRDLRKTLSQAGASA